jgi:hypothetical protein
MNRLQPLRIGILLGFALAAMFLPIGGGTETPSRASGQAQATTVTAPHGPAACPVRENSESQGVEFDLYSDRASAPFAPCDVRGLASPEARASLAISLQTLHVRLDL